LIEQKLAAYRSSLLHVRNIIKQFIRKVCKTGLNTLLKIIYKIYDRTFRPQPMIIVKVDGGICSQMEQYLLGYYYLKKNYIVKFDIDYYKNDGMDMDKIFARNFDLLKAFPGLNFTAASKNEVRRYNLLYYYPNNPADPECFKKQQAPLYFGDYYRTIHYLDLDEFKRLFKIDFSLLDQRNRIIYEKILGAQNPVGIHVRRGDMKKSGYYWCNPQDDYFINAMKYISEKYTDANFFFFSDEADWVRENIVFRLSDFEQRNCIVVDINGSDRGYMDLFLLSACKHFITSQGSLGKFAFLLSNSSGDNGGGILTFCSSKDAVYNPTWIYTHGKNTEIVCYNVEGQQLDCLLH
jgi:hypothetical protein